MEQWRLERPVDVCVHWSAVQSQVSSHSAHGFPGATIRYLGAIGWSFCLAIFIYFTREIERFLFTSAKKYLFQYLYYIYFNLLCG